MAIVTIKEESINLFLTEHLVKQPDRRENCFVSGGNLSKEMYIRKGKLILACDTVVFEYKDRTVGGDEVFVKKEYVAETYDSLTLTLKLDSKSFINEEKSKFINPNDDTNF